jgi:YesN/AraC family two-component response regulator
MLIQNLALYQDKYYIRINEENDTFFYSFDYDARTADYNMQFQHFHTFYELCIFLCPNAVHFVEGIPYDVQAFDIVGISPNRLHKTQYPDGRPCKRIIIQFNLPSHVTGLSNEYEQLLKIFNRDVPIFRFGSELQKRLFGKLNDIYQLAPKQDSMRNLIIHQKFIEFLILLFLNQETNIYSSEAELSNLESKVYSVARYIHAHYPEELSLEFLAKHFGISTSYLSHRFKNVTGFSVTDYIQMTRIRNAQALLINTKIPITEISEPCGFNCFSQFNRVFRKHIGMSPSTYRKQSQAQQSIID